MGKHRLDYWRERTQLLRIAKGLEPTRDFVHAERFVKAGKELKLMEALPVLSWPRTLFGDNMTVAQLMAEQKAINRETDCICGKPHRQLIPWTQRSLYGQGWTIEYFCKSSCKDKAVAQVRS